MNETLYEEWALPDRLEDMYFRHLGGAMLAVIDEATGATLANASVVVTFAGDAGETLVARKRSRADGTATFGGWAASGSHTALVSLDGYVSQNVTVPLQAGADVNLMVALGKA